MRRALTVGAVLLIVLSGPAAGQTTGLEGGGSFLDDDRRGAEPAIEALFAHQITNGCGPEIFCPTASVTRGEMATFLARALKAGPSETPADFSDLETAAFYTGFVNRLTELEIVTGYPDGSYRPSALVSRAEMAALLVRALGSESTSPSGAFRDVPDEAWFAGFVEALRVSGITNGCAADLFCPDHQVTREQMALFLARGFELALPAVPIRVSPLNGLPAPDGFSVRRRVVAVKVDNALRARPQSGIERADAMMELMVEGGLSRMVGLFHQSDAEYVGPVRSVRPTDAVLDALGATIGISGAQRWIADRMAAEGLGLIREGQVGPPVLFRIPERVAPYNLYTSTYELRAEADRRGYPDSAPPSLFNFGPFQYPASASAGTIDVSWSDPVSTVWTWDGARYRRSMGTTPHFWIDRAGATAQMAADTLIVIFGQYYEVSPPPGIVGSTVPAMSTVGSGRMLMFSNGRVVDGVWWRPDNETWFIFSANGSELIVPPGIPWIHIIPHDRPVTWR
ncbi:MAG: DUF3048 domain-containing protein [Acidimicrobiia bacterium]